MPSLLSARPPKLAPRNAWSQARGQPPCPGDWIARARMITRSWDGARTSQIAAELHCHPQTEHERSQLIALVKQPPPGRLRRQAHGSLHADQPENAPHWTLDTLAQAAQASGIQVQRSQIRRILLAEGSAGAGRAPGPSPATRSSPQKDRDRRALHPSVGPRDGRLRR